MSSNKLNDILEEAKNKFAAAGKEWACRERALFLSDASLPALCFFIFLLFPITALLIVYLMKLGDPKMSEPIQTVDPSSQEAGRVPITPPPAYNENSEADHPSSYSDLRWGLSKHTIEADRDEDAANFVKGTATFAVVVFLLFLVALSVQSLSWCHDTPTWLSVILWMVYGGLGLFVLRGLAAWIILFRNLWGKQARERVVIRDDFLVNGVLMLACLPYRGAVAGVRACQRLLCGHDDGNEDLELGVTPSSARFPPDVRDEPSEAKSTPEGHQMDEDEEHLDKNTAETRGLLSGREGPSSA